MKLKKWFRSFNLCRIPHYVSALPATMAQSKANACFTKKLGNLNGK